MLTINYNDKSKENLPEVGALLCGTIIVGAPGQPESIYMKVNTKSGAGVKITWSSVNCLILNLKTGQIRQIPSDTPVRVYDGELVLSKCKDIPKNLKSNNYMEF